MNCKKLLAIIQPSSDAFNRVIRFIYSISKCKCVISFCSPITDVELAPNDEESMCKHKRKSFISEHRFLATLVIHAGQATNAIS